MDTDIIRGVIGVAGIPLIIALVEALKPYIRAKRLYPVVAIVLGLALNLLAAFGLGASTRAEWVAASIWGVVTGLAASGLYSAGATMRSSGR